MQENGINLDIENEIQMQIPTAKVIFRDIWLKCSSSTFKKFIYLIFFKISLTFLSVSYIFKYNYKLMVYIH